MSLNGITGSDVASGPGGSRAVAATAGVMGTRSVGPRGTGGDSERVNRRTGSRTGDSFQLDQGRDRSSAASQARDGTSTSDTGIESGSSAAILTQVFAQEAGNDASQARPLQASQVQAGVSAYERASQTLTAPSGPGAEIISPSGSVLSSGRSLDLAV